MDSAEIKIRECPAVLLVVITNDGGQATTMVPPADPVNTAFLVLGQLAALSGVATAF